MSRPRTFSGRALDSSLRGPLAGFAFVAALAHIPVVGPHLEEAPYMGVLFIVLTSACLAVAAAVLVHDSPLVYVVSAVICGSAVLGYAATRLVAFPMLADDVGNWLEPLGVVSVLAETAVVLLSIIVLGHARRPTHGRAADYDSLTSGGVRLN